MTEPKHTATPWRVHWRSLDDSSEVKDANNEPVADYCSHANAKTIVRSVNAHSALLAACEAAQEYMLGKSNGNGLEETLSAAIKLAKEGAEPENVYPGRGHDDTDNGHRDM